MPLILDILKTARLSQRHTLQQPPANNHSKDNAIIFHKEQTVSINICVSECVHCVLLRQPLQLDSVRWAKRIFFGDIFSRIELWVVVEIVL